MTAHCAPPSNLQPLYFVEDNCGKLGRWFPEVDRDTNSRAEVVRQIRNGSLNPIKVLEVTEPCDDFPLGRCIDVTAELCAEAEQQRDPPTLEELHQRLVDFQRDHERDYLKNWVA